MGSRFAFQIYDEDNSGELDYDEVVCMVMQALNAQGDRNYLKKQF